MEEMTMEAFLGDWLEYFEVNAALPDEIPWGREDSLRDEEMAAIGRSMATFQLGESSDGQSLSAASEACARRFGWRQLPLVTAFFIREEQNHAALLGRYMDKHGIPRLNREWTDQIFRRLRKGLFGVRAD